MELFIKPVSRAGRDPRVNKFFNGTGKAISLRVLETLSTYDTADEKQNVMLLIIFTVEF